jgi:glycosyltransferase involved in cell wall biosynthesis
MKVLFISHWFPYPPDNGSKIRIFNLIKYLSSCHEVELIAFSPGMIAEERLAAMRRYCQRVDIALHRPFQPNRLKALLGFLHRWPRSIVDTHSVEMQRLVEQAQRGRSFDVVVASQMGMAPYALALPGTPRVLEEVELTTLYEQFSNERHPLRRLRNWLTWWKLSYYVTDVLRAFDGCTVVSERERERVLQLLPGYEPIGVVPNGVDLASHAADFGSPTADTLVYPGSLTYGANFDAMDFFLHEVFPLIRAKRPNVRISITGKLDGVPVDRLPCGDGVVLTGYLDDVRPTVAQSWACVVPLQIGGGTRLKVLEAMALGTPVVATSKGVEGLEVTPGEDILIADEPASFADATLRLLGDQVLRAKLAANGRRLARERYGWDQIGRKLDQFLHQVTRNHRHQGAG